MRTRDRQADFAVFTEDGQLVAVAEAKKKPKADAQWAAAWFSNYLGREEGSAAPFVLLATPETLYVWKRVVVPSAEPTAVVDARRVFSSYVHRTNSTPSELSGRTFEFIVGAWLNDLSHRLWQPSAPEEIRAFVDTGLMKAVENGRVVTDIAA
jgi:hypothetical protein